MVGPGIGLGHIGVFLTRADNGNAFRQHDNVRVAGGDAVLHDIEKALHALLTAARVSGPQVHRGDANQTGSGRVDAAERDFIPPELAPRRVREKKLDIDRRRILGRRSLEPDALPAALARDRMNVIGMARPFPRSFAPIQPREHLEVFLRNAFGPIVGDKAVPVPWLDGFDATLPSAVGRPIAIARDGQRTGTAPIMLP